MLGLSATVTVDAYGPSSAEDAVGDWFLILDVGLGIATYVAVHWRRRWPVTITVALSLASAFSGIAAAPALLALVSLATRRRAREIALVSALSMVCAQQYSTFVHGFGDFWISFGSNVVGTAAAVGWGLYLGSRRELVWTLRQRAEPAEAEQTLRVAQARTTERQRIAREMHDVMAHRISQISLHAGALGFRADLSAEAMRESARVIQEKAHEALTDLRDVLGVLRDGQGELVPQPTYADLTALIEEARATGTAIDVSDEVCEQGQPISDSTGRTIYRIVQEGLTNARKHAPGARVTVRLTGSPDDGLELELRNRLGFGTGTPGSGLGLIGLAERAELAGGRLHHSVEDGQFALQVWIPWST